MSVNPIPTEDPDYDVQWDPEAMRKYGGNWVVVVGREVIAADPDPDQARRIAAAKLGIEPQGIIVTAVSTPEQAWLP